MNERPQFYVAKFLNPSAIDGFSSFSLAKQTDSDAPFRLFGIAFYVYDAAGHPQGPRRTSMFWWNSHARMEPRFTSDIRFRPSDSAVRVSGS